LIAVIAAGPHGCAAGDVGAAGVGSDAGLGCTVTTMGVAVAEVLALGVPAWTDVQPATIRAGQTMLSRALGRRRMVVGRSRWLAGSRSRQEPASPVGQEMAMSSTSV
jgi:hypothetical protein